MNLGLLKITANLIFYGLILILAVYSAVVAYVLMRFGKSKMLGLVLLLFYFLIMFSLYAAAVDNFGKIPFPS